MSYVSNANDPRRRATAIVAVGAIHAMLGLGLVAGLTVAGYGPIEDERVTTVNVPLEPPPPEPATEPDRAEPAQQPTVLAPLPPLALPRPVPAVEPFDPDAVILIQPTPIVPTPRPTLEPSPSPSASFAPKNPAPSGNAGRWITNDDYPAGPLRQEAEGTAGYRLVIGTDGRVDACEIVSSTGNAQLDAATCRLLERRARFEPATDSSGARVVGTYTGTVSWRITG